MIRCLLLLSTFALLLPAADRIAIGLTAKQSRIEAWTPAPAADSRLPRVVWIGGFDGAPSETMLRELASYERNDRQRKRFHVTAIPLANPDKATLQFPPTGDAYRDNAESHVLWRWLATEAPDLIVVGGADSDILAQALAANAVAGVGKIPVRTLPAKDKWLDLSRDPGGPSEARREVERRQARSPRQVAELLSRTYGQDFTTAVYIPAFALWGRLRLGQTADVERIVSPYVTGAKDSLVKPTSSHLSGHLIFAELAERTKKPEYRDRVLAAANYGFTESGEMKESMPFHSEMSDSVFMGCPILVKAGKLTGDRKYFDMALKHYRFMRKLDLRADGLWRHSPKDEAAWGRGNAFAILGLGLSLSDLPQDHAAYEELLRDFRNLAATLARQQDHAGMWRQVVDLSGSYRELSATSIIAAMLARGVKRGWLDAKSYTPRVERAWRAVSARTSDQGELIDVCESTGAQNSLTDYLRRKAILGVDPRGGAMVMLLATEIAGL
jgi:rhamnogalacturonyl hydrolase YesR